MICAIHRRRKFALPPSSLRYDESEMDCSVMISAADHSVHCGASAKLNDLSFRVPRSGRGIHIAAANLWLYVPLKIEGNRDSSSLSLLGMTMHAYAEAQPDHTAPLMIMPASSPARGCSQ